MSSEIASIVLCILPVVVFYAANPLGPLLTIPLMFGVVMGASFLFLYLQCKSAKTSETNSQIAVNASIIASIPAIFFLIVSLGTIIPPSIPVVGSVLKVLHSIIGLCIAATLTSSGYQAISKTRGC